MKKKIILLLCLFISFISSFSHSQDIFITDSKNMISVLLTLLGLSFTGFSFISSLITLFKKKNKKLNDLIIKIYNSVEKDILLILYLVLVLVLLNVICNYDIPIIKNKYNISFLIFTIFSLKTFTFNFLVSLSFLLSFYAFYDLVKATFKLIKKCDNL